MGNRKKLVELKPIRDLTETEWIQELEHIDNQLTHILDVVNFLEEFFQLNNKSEAAHRTFNTNPLFWKVLLDCLQESLFMGLGRLCDPSSDAVSVSRVVKGAMSHPEFFSATALRQRLEERKLTKSLDDHLQANAWTPVSGGELRFLKTAIASHLKRLEDSYLPIRNSYYGHRPIESDASTMFAETNRVELWETLDMLRQLLGGLRFFYDNGAKPRVDIHGTKALDLVPRRSFRDLVQSVVGCEL